jgi:hypothetical protein
MVRPIRSSQKSAAPGTNLPFSCPNLFHSLWRVLSSLYHFFHYLGRKVLVAAVIGVLAIVTYATWLFLQDKTDYDVSREQQVHQLEQSKAALIAQHDNLLVDVTKDRKDLAFEQDRVDRAAKLVTTLEPMQSRWERWFGDRAQQDAIDARIVKARDIENTSRTRLLELQSSTTKKDWEINVIDQQLTAVNAEIAAVSRIHSWVWHYLIAAWFQIRWFLLVAAIIYFIGTPLRRASFFIFVSRLLSKGKSLRFNGEPWDVSEVAEKRESIDVELWPGERLRVRRAFARTGDEDLNRGKKFFLHARFPMMSIFGGLTRLVELRHSRAREPRVVTLSTPPERQLDFAMFNVPEGGSLMLRARYLAGVVLPANGKLRVRARWRIWDRHAWAAGQLRFLEFCGPCRLVVVSKRKLRLSHVPAAEATKKPSRVAERRRVIGFSPSLEFRQVRAARFWRYVFSGRELLDGRFIGAGLMLSEEPMDRTARRARRPLVRGLWNNLIDAFGY